MTKDELRRCDNEGNAVGRKCNRTMKKFVLLGYSWDIPVLK